MAVDETTEEPSSLSVRLGDLWAVIQIQWMVVAVTVATCITLALLYSAVAKREYRSYATIQLSTVAGRELDVEGVVDMDVANRGNRTIFVTTQLEIMRSRPMREEIIRQYNAAGYDDLTPQNGGVDRLAGMFAAIPRPATELIDLSVTHSDPEKAAVLANLISATYIKKNLEARVETQKGSIGWLTGQIELYRKKIQDAADRLAAYKQQHGLADIEEDTSTIEARLAALNVSAGAVGSERVQLESTVRAHDELLRKRRWRELADDLNTPVISSLAQDHAQQTVALGALSERYGPNMPQHQIAQTRLQEAEKKLNAEVTRAVDSERAALEVVVAREKSLQTEIDHENDLLMKRQQLRTEYDVLSGELALAKQYYADMNEKLLETTLAAETQRNNVRKVDDARPNPNAVSPQTTLNALAGLMIGLVAGIALAFLREQVDDTIATPVDVSMYLRVPYLGMIPKIAGVTDEAELALYTFHHPTSSASEGIRAIRTMLELNPPEGGLKRLLVTSAVSSEGKTSTVVRFGVAFANLGKRVVMIDGDLRRPRIHKIFQIDKDPGLTALLEGSPIEEVVRGTGVPNLFFIPAGATIGHTTEPLASRALERLLDELDKRFDLVIIDTPPSALLSDAAILSKQVDGVVMLVRESTASRILVRDAIRSLNAVGANVLGVVINAVDASRRRSSKYYYYSQSYKYNRYYTDTPSDDQAAK